MKKLFGKVKYIAFDADDTLWVNEPYFREAEAHYCKVLERFASAGEIIDVLYKTEIKNLAPYGYGAKAFTLSLMETAINLSNNSSKEPLSPTEMGKIIEIGTSLIKVPINILPGVEQLLEKLSQSGKYTLVLATKGDLLDQQRKLERSGLAKYFQYLEVMSDKTPQTYATLLDRLGCNNKEFLMIGNSMKSDILPVLELGGYGIYIPFYSTWEHEKVAEEIIHPNLYESTSCKDLLEVL